MGRSVDIMSGWQTLSVPIPPRTSIAVLILVMLSSTQAGGEAKAPTPATAPAPIAAPAAPSVEPTVAPLTVKLEPVGPLKLESGKGPAWWTFWVPVIGPLISGLLAYFGVRLSLDIAQRNNTLNIGAAQRASEAAIWQKANETELKELLAKLDGFYGPFMQMSQANHLMIEEFRSRQEPGFRTLPKVFDRAWLAALGVGDRKIVSEVCQKAADLEKFIALKRGRKVYH